MFYNLQLGTQQEQAKTVFHQWVAGVVLFFIIAVTVGGYIFLQTKSPDNSFAIGQTVPSLPLTSLDGQQCALDSLIQMRTALIFFTTTCAYCLEELRSWKMIYSEFNDSLQLVAVSLSRTKETIEWAETEHIPFSIYVDESFQVRKEFHVSTVPVMYFIDSQKRVKSYVAGKRNGKQLRTLIKQYFRTEN